jgi:hypothetical protein
LRGDGEETGGLLGLGSVGAAVGEDVFLGVGDGLEKLASTDELDVLLETDPELKRVLVGQSVK